jgi:hypothetical protein
MEIGDVKAFGNVSIRSHDIGIKQLRQFVQGIFIHTCEAARRAQWRIKLLRYYLFQSKKWN